MSVLFILFILLLGCFLILGVIQRLEDASLKKDKERRVPDGIYDHLNKQALSGKKQEAAEVARNVEALLHKKETNSPSPTVSAQELRLIEAKLDMLEQTLSGASESITEIRQLLARLPVSSVAQPHSVAREEETAQVFSAVTDSSDVLSNVQTPDAPDTLAQSAVQPQSPALHPREIPVAYVYEASDHTEPTATEIPVEQPVVWKFVESAESVEQVEPVEPVDPVTVEPQSEHRVEDEQSAHDETVTPPLPKKEPVYQPSQSMFDELWQLADKCGLSRDAIVSNIWAIAGVGILFIAVVLLMRYMIQTGILGPQVRLIISTGLGYLLWQTGWRMRHSKSDFGCILQGGGFGILYLTVVAAVQLFEMIPSSVGFFLLVVFVVLSSVLAVQQKALVMAHLSFVAGFIAPFAISTGQGNYVVLFSFYVALNIGILYAARREQWTSLRMLGVACTILFSGLWGALRYEPEMFRTIEIFLCLFFMLFAYGIPLSCNFISTQLFSRNTVRLYYSLAFAVPSAFLAYQYLLVDRSGFTMALLSLLIGLIYCGIARYLHANQRGSADGESLASELTEDRMHFILYLALGIVFTNLALPLCLLYQSLAISKAQLLALIWSTEMLVFIWLAWKKRAQFLYPWSVGLLILSLVCWGAPQSVFRSLLNFGVVALGWFESSSPVSLNEAILRELLVIVQFSLLSIGSYGLFSLGAMKKWEREFPILLGVTGLVFIFRTFDTFAMTAYSFEGCLFTFAITGYCLSFLLERIHWKAINIPVIAAYVVVSWTALTSLRGIGSLLLSNEPPFSIVGSHTGFIVLFLLAEATWLYYAYSKKTLSIPWNVARLVATGALAVPFVTLLVINAAVEWVPVLLNWYHLLLVVPAICIALSLIRFVTPAIVSLRVWLMLLFVPVSWLIISVLNNISIISSMPGIIYLPVVNAADAALLASFCTLAMLAQAGKQFLREKNITNWYETIAVTCGLVIITIITARFCVVYFGMPYTVIGLIRNPVCQGLLSILWAIAGVLVMLFAFSKCRQQLWNLGRIIVVAVVVKLFVIDLQQVAVLWRIVAFFCVGILLLGIARYMPVFPKQSVEPEEKEVKNTSSS